MPELRRKHQLNNYDFCFGMSCNWYDMNTGRMYMIQEYKEAIDKGEKPTHIRAEINGVTVGQVTPLQLKQLMEDPEPDPRY